MLRELVDDLRGVGEAGTDEYAGDRVAAPRGDQLAVHHYVELPGLLRALQNDIDAQA